MQNDIYKDDFTVSLGEESDFSEFIKEREKNAVWKTSTTNKIKFFGYEDAESIPEKLREHFQSEGKYDVLTDTLAGTKLLACIDGEHFPIRDTAYKTILERANISGNALKRVKKPVLAKILNDCINVAKGLSLIRFADDKISAIHSGDNSYSILDMRDLFDSTCDWLTGNFPDYKFVKGDFDHSLVTSVWQIPDYEELLDPYKEMLSKLGKENEHILPALRFTSSDVGISGANLTPMLYLGEFQSIRITLGSALKLEHRNGASISKFSDMLEQIYSRFTLAIGKLTELLAIEIEYPSSCMGHIMKKLGLPKKQSMQALEDFKNEYGMKACTAHEIYFGISNVLFLLEKEGVTGTKIAHTEEIIARALSFRWRDYDIAGEFVW